MMTDSKLLLLVTQKTELVELISFLAFFSLPFPLLGFTKILMPGKEKMFGKLQGCFWMMAVIYTVNLYDRPDPCDCGDRGRAFLYGSHDYPCIVLWSLSYQRA